jgi:hypothetical protein
MTAAAAAEPLGSAARRPPIGAHRLLGAGRGAALIRPNAEIDWWCPNRFDARPELWSLLGPDGGFARWSDVEIATWDAQPAGPTATTFVRHDGVTVALWDGLLCLGEGSMLVRLARLAGGSAGVAISHELRCGGFDGPWRTWVVQGDRAVAEGLVAIGRHRVGSDETTLLTTIELEPDRWTGFAILVGADPSEVTVDGLAAVMSAADDDESGFLRGVHLPRMHPNRVLDAMRVLRVLTDPATGATVAAPTTSVPEAPGGDRQFDYRFAWLRDSAHASSTAALLGRRSSSARYLDFVADVVERFDGHLQPLTTTAGERVPEERTVPGIATWDGSSPVRVGNAATEQVQIDSLSTVIEAVSVHMQCGGWMTRRRWRMLDRLATMVADAPFEPANGIWELREPKRLVTEELARWIGLDKAIRLQRIFRPWRPRPDWVRARAAARARVASMLDRETGLLPQSFDGPPVPDAATLLACTNTFVARGSAASRRLAEVVIAQLGEGAFLRRYPDGVDGMRGRESAFVPSSWLAVSALLAAGDIESATQRADEMCAQLPPLQPEEWDVERGEGMGNTPLLWSHAEAARALYNLHIANIRRRYTVVGAALWRIGRYVRLRLSRPR